MNNETRKKLLKKKGKCKCCGTRNDLTMDHIIPKSKGGTLRKENRQVLCRACNQKKGILIIDYNQRSIRLEPWMFRLSSFGRNLLFDNPMSFSGNEPRSKYWHRLWQ